ncbi:MAG TPA: helix-turn-helix domain-containing protein [Nevskiaceae bacterium]|nr:helix-turn-helix domain-containing protein [Nevskiaceae bacterium]
MAAAQKEFADKGYRETSNKMVAERAGVTAGSIYHYFDSKRDLFLAVHDQIQEQVMARLNTAFESATTFKDAILRLLDEFERIRTQMPSANGFTAVVRTEALRNPEIAQARVDAQWRTLFRRLTDLGVKTGEIDPSRAHLVRTVISAINLGVVQHGSEATDSVHAECMMALGELVNGTLLQPRRKGR